MTWFQFDILWPEQIHCWTTLEMQVKVDVDEEKGAELLRAAHKDQVKKTDQCLDLFLFVLNTEAVPATTTSS